MSDIDALDEVSAGEESANESNLAARREMPLPGDVKLLLLVGIFGLLALHALSFTGEIVLPVLFAFMLNLLLLPVMRFFARMGVPRALGAALLIVMFFGAAGGLGFALSGPAAVWVAKAPESLPRLEQRLWIFKKPVADMQNATKQVEKITEGGATDVPAVKVAGPGLGGLLFSGTRSFVIGAVTTIMLLFFLLMSGDMFLRRLVEILPTLSNKKQAVDISREVVTKISGYLVTISMLNAAVGVATGIACYFCGLSDPVLWGFMAFFFNYVPIIGPLCVIAILVIAGLLTFDDLVRSVLPGGIYFLIHIAEGEVVTPLLLARQFTLNPVLVIISLMFWYWMWGVAGALLAVPLLATFKIMCDRIEPLMALGHFLGAEARE